jgi:hypothetical protein
MKIKRGVGIMFVGAGMLLAGHFLSQVVLDLIPTINPANSSLIADTNYHMISLSNQLSTISQFGIILLVIGAMVFFIDKKRTHTQN